MFIAEAIGNLKRSIQNMHIRKLTAQDIPDLLNTLNGAFADYIVPYKLNAAQLHAKMESEGILPEWSVGVFEDNQLVAFIMHGVRETAAGIVVYNGGTGVLPSYRGQGLVGKMYQHIQPFFEEMQVQQIVLEVIGSNHAAIRAYEKEGFAVQRKLLCFGGELQTKSISDAASIKALPGFLWKEFQSFWDISPSWQSAIPSMDSAQPNVLGAFINDELVGYVLFNQTNKRFYHIAVAGEHRRKGIGTQLLEAVKQQLSGEKIRIINVDESAENLKLFLEKQGLSIDVVQLEMVKKVI